MKRFLLCIGLSLVVLLTFNLTGSMPAPPPEKATGNRYWRVIFLGTGRELKREGNRIYFYSQSEHEWFYYWTTQAEVDDTIAPATKAWIDDWLRFRRSAQDGSLSLDKWDKSQFQTLTGYDFDKESLAPLEWWKQNRKPFSPTASHVSAFLEERKVQSRLRHEAERQLQTGLDINEDIWSLLGNHELSRFEWLYSERVDRQIEKWNKSYKPWWNFRSVTWATIVLVLLCAYGLPSIVRRFLSQQR